MDFLLFWVGFAIVVGVAANARGRSGLGWFFLSLAISPLIGLLLVLVMRRIGPDAPADPYNAARAQVAARYDAKPAAPLMKKCPDCAEMVQAEAKICRFCRHDFPAPPPAPSALAPAAAPGAGLAARLSEQSTRGCRSCGQSVPITARVCRHCGVAQDPS